MRRAQFRCQFQPIWTDIDADNRCTADNARSHDRAQAYRTGTKYSNTAACMWSKRIDHTTSTCLNTTAERTQDIQGHILAHFHHIFLTCQRSEEHTSELQSRQYLVCRLLLEKKKNKREILYEIN